MAARFLLVAGILVLGWVGSSPGQETKRKEERGDALPAGARARLGTYRDHLPAGATLAPDGKIYALVDNDEVIIGDVASGDRRWLKLGPELASPLTFSPDSRFLLVNGKKRGDLRLVDLAAGRIVKQGVIPAPKDKIAAPVVAVFAAEGKHVAVAWSEGSQLWVWVWELASGSFGGPFKTEVSQNVREFRLALRGMATDNAGSPVVFALSANGQTVAVQGKTAEEKDADGRWQLRLWDVPTVKPRSLVRTAHPIQAAGFSPDGRALAVASGACSFALFDVASGQEMRAFLGQVRPPDPPALRTQYWGNDIVFLTDSFAVHSHPARKPDALLQFSRDGKTLVWSRRDKAQRWDVATGKRRGVFTGPTETITSLDVEADALTAHGNLGQRRLTWKAGAGKLPVRPKLGNSPINWLGYTRDGDLLAWEGNTHFHRWDAKTGKLLSSEPNPLGTGNLAFSSDGKYVLESASAHRVLDVASRQPLFHLEGQGALVAWQPGSHRLGWFYDKTVRIYDCNREEEVWRHAVKLPPQQNETVSFESFDLAPGGQIAIFVVQVAIRDVNTNTNTQARDILFWDLTKGKLLGRNRVEYTAYSQLVSPDGQVTLLATYTNHLLFFRTGTGKLWHQVSWGGKERLSGWQFSPDGRTVAAIAFNQADSTSSILIWEVATGQLRARLRGHRALRSIAWHSPRTAAPSQAAARTQRCCSGTSAFTRRPRRPRPTSAPSGRGWLISTRKKLWER